MSSPSVQRQFLEKNSGIPLGWAVFPEDWGTDARYAETKIDEITPFGTTISCADAAGNFSVGCRYGEHWYYFPLNGPLQLGYSKQQCKKYLDPDLYLQDVAQRLVKAKVVPVSSGPLDTLYNRNRVEEARKMTARFEENAHVNLPNVQCELRLQDILCESRAAIFRYQKGTVPYTVIAGADLFGMEIYDAAAIGVLNRTLTKGIKSILPGKKKQEDFVPGSFGHSYEEGDAVDLVDWGSRRLYFAIGPTATENQLLQHFLTFAKTWKQDPSLDQRLEQIHYQVHQQELAQLQGVTNYALQSQMINAQKQREISRTLSETSDLVMQGYQNRMASQDRISKNWSEAIRGVNSYSTTDGRTVEHSVTSDHVYQTPYGDTVGVSGTLPEVPADWTELQRKS